MNGFLNINKPSGITSYDVIRRIKPGIRRIKLGHLGTLDPMAEGVLPIAIGRATRVIRYIKDDTKEYRGEMILGGISDTQDRTGNINRINSVTVEADRINEVFNEFVGEIEQIPPMFSAVHYQGRRLYELARQGIEVPVKPRRVKIHYFSLHEVVSENNQQIVRFSVGCSTGTYVRTICHDVGQKLGCGAYLTSLTRTRSGPFKLNEAVDLEYLINTWKDVESLMLPIDYPLHEMSKVVLEPSLVRNINNGGAVNWPGVEDQKRYLVYDQDGRFLAIARGNIQNNNEVLKPEKVLIGGEN